MSVQIFLQGYFHGIEDFLISAPPASELPSAGVCGERLLIGRSRWVSLLSEILPRALLLELNLPAVLLGSSGGGQFLLVLPDEVLPQAASLLERAADAVRELTGGLLRLYWSSTENLGDWSVVRKRLSEKNDRLRNQPLSPGAEGAFEPFDQPDVPDTGGYFTSEMGALLRDAPSAGWSPESPARVRVGEGKHTWPLGGGPDAVPVARHAAPGDDSSTPASPIELAARAQGRKAWGVLHGDVDNFGLRMRRAQSIEEHVQLSLLYKRFFAGELEVLCSMPEFWQRVSVFYTGGNDFAVFGSWDALVLLARELQRLFHRFSEENLKDIPGTEGKTISMALSMAPEPDSPLAEVYRDASAKLQLAKSANKDCFYVFGHPVEWRQLAQAAELQDNLGRLVRNFGGSPQLLGDLIRYYKRGAAGAGTDDGRVARPWRYHRRLSLVAAGARDREYQKLRSRLVMDLIGKSAAQARLRPGGRVALEWARLMSEA